MMQKEELLKILKIRVRVRKKNYRQINSFVIPRLDRGIQPFNQGL